MKNNLLNIAAFLCLVLFMGSCSPVTEEVKPSNVIESSGGLKIALEWTTGSSSTQAKEDADMELLLLKGTEEIRVSDGYGFESLVLESIFADGNYTIAVDAYRVNKKADYTIYVTDADGEQTKTYTGYYNAGDVDMSVSFLTIKKAGNTFTLTEL